MTARVAFLAAHVAYLAGCATDRLPARYRRAVLLFTLQVQAACITAATIGDPDPDPTTLRLLRLVACSIYSSPRTRDACRHRLGALR